MPTIGAVRCLRWDKRRWPPDAVLRTLRSMETFDRTAHNDSWQPRFTAASVEEIRLAEQLRQQIQQRYLGQANRTSDPYWCIGAD